MRRRDFITSVIFAVMVRRARAQQPPKVYRIAIVFPATPVAVQRENAKTNPGSRVLWARLRELGFVDGQNLVVERYSGEGRTEEFAELARGVVRSNPDVILADSARLVLALKAATTTIPIVGITSDPVAWSIASNLARPGGNITGVSVDEGIEIYGKCIGLLAEAVPGLSKIGFLASRKMWEMPSGAAMREAAGRARISIVGPPLEPPLQEEEYQHVIAAMTEAGAQAVVVATQSETFANCRMIAELIKKARLPAIYPCHDSVAAGGLMALVYDAPELNRRLADDIAQVLKGTNPGDIPYYQATKFELIINLKAAESLGLTIPPSLLARADEVIE